MIWGKKKRTLEEFSDEEIRNVLSGIVVKHTTGNYGVEELLFLVGKAGQFKRMNVLDELRTLTSNDKSFSGVYMAAIKEKSRIEHQPTMGYTWLEHLGMYSEQEEPVMHDTTVLNQRLNYAIEKEDKYAIGQLKQAFMKIEDTVGVQLASKALGNQNKFVDELLSFRNSNRRIYVASPKEVDIMNAMLKQIQESQNPGEHNGFIRGIINLGYAGSNDVSPGEWNIVDKMIKQIQASLEYRVVQV
jgi:hypothetical protein